MISRYFAFSDAASFFSSSSIRAGRLPIGLDLSALYSGSGAGL